MDVIMQRSGREDERRQDCDHARGIWSVPGVPSVTDVPGAKGAPAATVAPGATGVRSGRSVARAGSGRIAIRGSAWVATMLMAAGVCLATDYTWIGAQNDCSLPYYDEAYWSPDPGWPNCCDDVAVVSNVCASGSESVIELTVSGLSGVGIEQLTVKEGVDDDDQQAVILQNVDSPNNYPVLKCEVYVVDATNAEYEVTVQAASYAKIQTVGTCICAN